MALMRSRTMGKDVKKSSYYVWYLGTREAKSVDAMPKTIDYLLQRERLQEPFKVTLQVSSKGLKIIQSVHPGSTQPAVKQLVPSHAVLAAVQRDDVVAATLLLPNPATNNPVHVHAYRCDSVETADLLGGQLKLLALNLDNFARLMSSDNRLKSDGRSNKGSESSDGSGELRHLPIQATTVYESLAAELRAKLGRGNFTEKDTGPILLPPRDYDTMHRQRGNLAGIDLRRCLNQTIVGGSTPIIERNNGTRSAASSGIGSDSAATPPPYNGHQLSEISPSKPMRDSSSDDDWGAVPTEDPDYSSIERDQKSNNVTLPRIGRNGSLSPEHSFEPSAQHPAKPRTLPPIIAYNYNQSHAAGKINNGLAENNSKNESNSCVNKRNSAVMRQRSLSPQYQPSISALDVAGSKARFHDAKEKFKQMEREACTRPALNRTTFSNFEKPPTQRLNSNSRESPQDNQRRQFVQSFIKDQLYHDNQPPPNINSSYYHSNNQNNANGNAARHNSDMNNYNHREKMEKIKAQLINQQAMRSYTEMDHGRNSNNPQNKQRHQPLASKSGITTSASYMNNNQPIAHPDREDMPYRAYPKPFHHFGMQRGQKSPQLQHHHNSFHYQPTNRHSAPENIDKNNGMLNNPANNGSLESTKTEALAERARPRSFYEISLAAKELRGPRNLADDMKHQTRSEFLRNLHSRDPQMSDKTRSRPFVHQNLHKDRYLGFDRDSTRPALEMNPTTARHRHSYAEPARLGLAGMHYY